MASETKLALGIFDKVLDHLPNFGQRRKKQYMKHRKIFLKEKSKPRHQRDDNKMWTARNNYKLILEAYSKEVYQ